MKAVCEPRAARKCFQNWPIRWNEIPSYCDEFKTYCASDGGEGGREQWENLKLRKMSKNTQTKHRIQCSYSNNNCKAILEFVVVSREFQEWFTLYLYAYMLSFHRKCIDDRKRRNEMQWNWNAFIDMYTVQHCIYRCWNKYVIDGLADSE